MKKTLGTLISEVRKQNGMTQLELARQMGVTDKAVSKWERDLSCPDINSLPTLAEVLGVPIEDLMQVKGGQKSSDRKWSRLFDTACKAVALAMGIAVAVLSILGQLPSKSAFVLLGIGLACLALTALNGSDGEKP